MRKKSLFILIPTSIVAIIFWLQFPLKDDDWSKQTIYVGLLDAWYGGSSDDKAYAMWIDDDSTEGTHSLNSNPGIEIAGIEGTFQHYFFNEEGALYSVKFELPYDFGKVDFNSLGSVDDYMNFVQTIPNGLISGKDTYNLEPGNLYYDLISRLTDKYGNPLTVDKSAFQGKTLADAIEYYLEGDVHGSKIEYKEWLIEQSDGSAIKIECAYVGHSYSMEALAGDGIFYLGYKLLWGYELIPSDVIKNAVDNEMAIYNDL